MNRSLLATDNLIGNWLAIVGGGVVVVLAVPFGLSAGFFVWSGFSRTKLPFTTQVNESETTIFWFLVQVLLFLYVAAFATGAMFENLGDYLSQL
jgi:ABC-type multidrug transport system fused ATPase/permease subunit